MARPIKFNPDTVLEQAMNLFWLQGYKNTSIKDVVAATQLQPGSIYAAFGNKKRLFQATLDRYCQLMDEFILSTLGQESLPPIDRLASFYHAVAEQSIADPDAKGCMIVNTLVATPIDDTQVLSPVRQQLQQVKLIIRGITEQAQQQGIVSSDSNIDSFADLLFSQVFSLRLFCKMTGDLAAAKAMIDLFLQTTFPNTELPIVAKPISVVAQ